MDWGFEGFPNAAVKIFSNGALATIAMKNHQVDIVIIDEMPAFEIAKAHNDTKIINIALTDEKYAIGIAPHNEALKDSIRRNEARWDASVYHCSILYAKISSDGFSSKISAFLSSTYY